MAEPVGPAGACEVLRELKRDLLGRIELVRGGPGLLVRRCPTATPLVGLVAAALARREQRALRTLDRIDGVPRAVALDGPGRGRGAFRSWIEGTPLSVVGELRTDFFDRLDALVAQLHARGVCHNDLHKEGNILVRPGGAPALIDFQLASVHVRRGREFQKRAAEDVRQVRKHRAVYSRGMDGDAPVLPAPRARTLSRLWRRTWKPFYNRLMRVTGLRRWVASGEPSRRRDDWPRWVEAPVDPAERGRS